MLPFLSFVCVFTISPLVFANFLPRDDNCSCGFYDTLTKELFTDSIIVYFNETDSLPDDFIIEDYQHKYEKDWNAIVRQGAVASNIELNGSDYLRLHVSPMTKDHLVNGGAIRTARRDIQYGSFRALMKSPPQNQRGTSLSMMWQYNETETTRLDVMNTDDPSRAWVGTFINDEFTSRDLGVNYSSALMQPSANRNYTVLGGGQGSANVNLWDDTEFRIDWTKEHINFFVGGNLTRSVLRKDKTDMSSVPAPFFFKHWSTGNRFSMEGPPVTRSEASIGWIRMFFNSSLMSEDGSDDFTKRCLITEACLMDDISIRGSTPFVEKSTSEWKQANNKTHLRMPAVWISVLCISFTSLLLLHTLILRFPRKKGTKLNDAVAPTQPSDTMNEQPSTPPSDSFCSRDKVSPEPPPLQPLPPQYASEAGDDLEITRVEPYASSNSLVWGGSTPVASSSRAGSVRFDSQGTTPQLLSPYASNFDTSREDATLPVRSHLRIDKSGKILLSCQSQSTIAMNTAIPGPEDKIQMNIVTESALPAPRMTPHPPPSRERIDYLAGIVALCALLVTVIHFGLTFVPAMVIPGAPYHYKSEVWAQKIISPFILNQMWLGVFFTTSVRFLVSGYLKRGNMRDIASAAVRRTPRLMIPVACIAMLEYFFVDCGATKYLRYIPSLTWSTWPYVTRFPTVGHFVSEVLELIYIIPNAVPQITFNFCTGVLWTIAVQLQGTWLVLCGVIVVYEIKSPWKRMGYYAFCIINHWYAQSWGSYLWFGLLLADLDITYKYKKYLHARPLAYYPLITFMWICVAFSFLANLITNYVSFNFSTLEHNIHPDPATAEPILNTPDAGYPPYYVPRLNGLLFAAGMQAIVELSPFVQWVLSCPLLLVLFPHIFTIYLLHGLIFWSWGSWLMVVLANHDFSYGVNVTIVGLTCYGLLFMVLPIVTPLIETLGKDLTALVWMSATEKPPPRRRTLYPFPADLFTRRGESHDVEANGTVGSGSHAGSLRDSTKSEKIGQDGLDGKEKLATSDTQSVKEISQFEGKLRAGKMRSQWEA